MEFLSLTAEALRSPPILFFLLGLLASILRSDLRFPESLSQALGLYLIMAIGFKGGLELTRHQIGFDSVSLVATGIAFSFFLPLLVNKIVPLFLPSLSPVDRLAIAAHYGSVSLVTFITATSFLDAHDTPYEGYFVMLLTLMETPALVSALLLYAKVDKSRNERIPLAYHLRHVVFAGSSFLLIGSFVIGFASGGKGAVTMYGFLNAPFQGILSLFLLDMGLVSGRQLLTTKDYSRRLLALGITLPIVLGTLGLIAGALLRLDVGDQMLFSVLCGSASYIVVPAALRMSMPEANHGLSITLALGITFPFNIIFGIPILYWLAEIF